jgi:hypothetical protein
MQNGTPTARSIPVTRWVIDVNDPTGIWIFARFKNTGRRLLDTGMARTHIDEGMSNVRRHYRNF